MRYRIGVDGLVQPAMMLAVRLLVSTETEKADRERTLDLALGDGAERSRCTERFGATDAQFGISNPAMLCLPTRNSVNFRSANRNAPPFNRNWGRKPKNAR